MKVAMVSGSCPPDTCGIGDYTATLVRELQARGVEVEIITGDQWSASGSISLKKQIQSARADIVHLQYPTLGYGMGLAPQALSLLMPLVVTIHEVSQAQVLRRLSLYPFSMRSRIIFTTHFERAYATRFAPWVSKRASVIPICSQIPSAPLSQEARTTDIVYFGLFRTNKGIEHVMRLAELVKGEGLPYVVRMVGAMDAHLPNYYNNLRSLAKRLPVVWVVGQDVEQVAAVLGRCQIGYMPFPDGASERRTSLLALLANGVAVVTTRGPHTPPEMEDCAEFADSPEHAISIILDLYRDVQRRAKLSAKAIAYAGRFSLDSIASQHIALYHDIVNAG